MFLTVERTTVKRLMYNQRTLASVSVGSLHFFARSHFSRGQIIENPTETIAAQATTCNDVMSCVFQ